MMARQSGEGTTLAIPHTASPESPEAQPDALEAPPPPEPARRPAIVDFLVRLGGDGLLIATAIVAVIFSVLQWASPSIVGIDGFYHIKAAWIMQQQGWGILLPMYFPWLQTTILNPAEFTDHHLLFHLALVPFTYGDLRIGAKISAVIFASLAMLAMYQLMSEYRIRWPLVWLIVCLGAAGPMLYRLSMTRRQSLTILLLLLAITVGFRRQTRWLLPIGFLFTWLFDGFPLLLGVCGAVFLGELWERRRPMWGLILYPAAGVLLGTLINPYFPNNILFSYLHMLPKVFQLVGLTHGDDVIQVGNEWYPYSFSFMIEVSWIAIVLVPLGLIPILLDVRPSQLRRVDRTVVALGIIAITFLLMYSRSRRWIEAEPIFATLFCAFAWSRALPERVTNPLSAFVTRRREIVAAVLVFLVMLVPLYRAIDDGRGDVRSTRDINRFSGAAAWLAQNTPLGARVYSTDWDDFPELYYWNTHNTYLIGLDPTYMYLHDGPLYLQWRAIGRGRVEKPGAIIRDRFDCGWVFSDLDHRMFLDQAAADPDLVEVYRDRSSVVFAVRGWQPRQ
jgi:hypothetical protein